MKTVDFSVTVAACDLKVGKCRQLIELIKVCEYSRSRSFLDHCPRSFTYENKNIYLNLYENFFRMLVAAIPIYVKNPSKILSRTS